MAIICQTYHAHQHRPFSTSACSGSEKVLSSYFYCEIHKNGRFFLVNLTSRICVLRMLVYIMKSYKCSCLRYKQQHNADYVISAFWHDRHRFFGGNMKESLGSVKRHIEAYDFFALWGGGIITICFALITVSDEFWHFSSISKLQNYTILPLPLTCFQNLSLYEK